MDANAHVGTSRCEIEGDAVGPHQPEQESWAGSTLRRCMDKHDLVLANTWWPAASGPTFHGGA
eukprot:3303775-Heterocapsa_arctica.AAC.1